MKRVRKYFVITRLSLQNAIAYRSSVVARFGFYTVFVYVFMMLWRAIYKEGSVHGYGYAQMVWYLLFTEFIGFACGTSVFNTMNEDVKSGAIAYLLGRPAHYVFYQLANSLGQVLFNTGAFGLLAVVLGFIFVGPLPGFRFATLPPIIFSLSLSILLNFFFMMLIGLSAFVIEDNRSLYLIYQKLNFMLGMLLPVEFLPLWLQPIAKSLPFSYVHWAPAKLFVAYSPELFWTLVPRQALWAGLCIVLVLLCYRGGARRLQVNGG